MAPTAGSAGAAVHVHLFCPTCLQMAHLRLFGGGGSIGGRMGSKEAMVEEIMETKGALATKKLREACIKTNDHMAATNAFIESSTRPFPSKISG
jgi:hypothetical protein